MPRALKLLTRSIKTIATFCQVRSDDLGLSGVLSSSGRFFFLFLPFFVCLRGRCAQFELFETGREIILSDYAWFVLQMKRTLRGNISQDLLVISIDYMFVGKFKMQIAKWKNIFEKVVPVAARVLCKFIFCELQKLNSSGEPFSFSKHSVHSILWIFKFCINTQVKDNYKNMNLHKYL